MVICDICGKTPVHGATKKHKRGVAGKRWMDRVRAMPRMFVPNLQKKTVVIDGEKKQMKLCGKCIKRIKKYKSIKNFKNITIV